MKLKSLTLHALAGIAVSVLALFPNHLDCQTQIASVQAETPTNATVWQHVGRLYLDPNTGKALYVGYLVHMYGVTNSLFDGSPSESTAYFTFSTDVLSLTPMPNNGNVALSLVSAGTFKVYYNSNPGGDWSNPATFASGRLVATFTRTESLFPVIGRPSLQPELYFCWAFAELQPRCPARHHLRSVRRHDAAPRGRRLPSGLCRRRHHHRDWGQRVARGVSLTQQDPHSQLMLVWGTGWLVVADPSRHPLMVLVDSSQVTTDLRK